MPIEARTGQVRLAELVAALSLGIDLGFGQPMEHVLRQCLIALRLADELVLTGDRDVCCSVEEAVTAFRMLSKGELAILPGEGHWLPDAAIDVTVDFLWRTTAARAIAAA